MATKKSKNEIATIDCSLVTIQVGENEFGFDTANQIQVEPQTEDEDAVKLVVKGILRAQKPGQKTITGNEITLTDNVFNPELVLVLQGGTIEYDQTDPNKIISYITNIFIFIITFSFILIIFLLIHIIIYII